MFQNEGGIFTFPLQISQTERLTVPVHPYPRQPRPLVISVFLKTSPKFSKVDFSPSPPNLPERTTVPVHPRPRQPQPAVISFVLKMPDFNSVPTRFDDDFNMGFNGRKLYDKHMVTSQGRSVWPEKLTARVPIETMVKGRGPHAGAGVHSVPSGGATGNGGWTLDCLHQCSKRYP